MRKNLLLIFALFFAVSLQAQSGFVFNCTRDTTLSCTETCITLRGFIPNIHSLADDYEVTPANAGFCRVEIPSSNVQGSPTNITRDDEYTQVIPLPFDFPFYGIYYSQLVAGSNGMVSFDDLNANSFCHYAILNGGGFLTATAGGGNTGEDLPSTLYDRALIMGPYHDIDIFAPPSPAKKIYYQVDGVAPYRRWILAFFEIPLYSAACNALFKNTHQIILNESTGIIDIYIYDKQICPGWNDGRAMIGLQNYDQDKGIMAPNRAASSPRWGSVGMNEAWRFTPKEGPSLFQRVELLDMSGTVIATGDTSSVTNTVFAVTFPNVCPTVSASYVIKSTYLKIDDPTVEVYGYDTVNIFKNSAVPPVTADTTRAVCGGNGTITVTAPLGINYEYSIDNGTTYQFTTTFSVPPGHYTVLVHDTTGNCFNSKEVDVTSLSPLIATAVSTNTSCPGVSNGSIAVHVSQGVPGFTFLIDTMTIAQTDSVFNNLGAGTHVITVNDNAGCSYVFNADVNSDASFTTTATSVNASCLGISNGSITVVQPATGAVPFQYSGDNGVTYQPGPLLSSLAGGVSYSIKVKDANGCTYSFTEPVGNNPGVSATDSVVISECAVASTGKIFIKTGTGVAPFTFSKDSGLTFQPADSFLNLLPGTYHIRVKDNAGCYFDFNSIVAAGTGVTATDSVVVSECAVAATGKIFIKTGLGIAPFTYSKDSGLTYQAANAFLNLLPGIYHIRVKDNVGCYYDFNSTVGTGTGVTATDSTVKSACATANTGKIFIKAGLGIAPFTYSRDSGLTYQPADSFLNLLPGVYHIRVKDNVGCFYDFNSTVGIGLGVTATDSTVKSACATANTGKIFIKAGLGIAPFTYSKDSGVTYQPADSFLNLLPGVYHIRVKDNVGCFYDFNSTVGIGLGVTATDSTVKSACATANTGKIFIKAGLGIAPFTYSKDSGVTYQPADSFLNLLPGVYHIRVKDNVGCFYDFNSTVGIGLGVTATDSTVKSACATANTGKIFIKAGLGIAPFTYSKDSGVTYQPADSFLNLLPGVYHIRVKDNVGCFYDFNSTVGVGLGVTATDSTVVTACNGVATGKIFIKTGLGIAPFTFSKDSGLIFQPADSFINLANGTYHIRVKDAVGCYYDFNSVVGAGVGVTASDSTVVSSCAAATTGKIFIKTGLGAAPFTFSKDSGLTFQVADSFLNLAPGVYHIRVKDNVGCYYDFNSTVGTGAGFTATDSTVKSACAAVATGKIFVTATSAYPPYSFSKDSGLTFQPGNSFTNLAPGTYHIRVKDAIGCTYDFNAVVAAEPGVNASFVNQNAACLGVSSGQITVTVTAGISPFDYSIDAWATSQPSNIFKNLASGSYNISIKDAVGCGFTSAPQNIGNDPGVTASFSMVNSACAGAATGAIIVKPTSGIRVFRYSLDAGATYQYDSVFRNLAANAYNVMIRDTLGCVLTSPVQNLANNPGVLTNPSTIKNASCASVPNGSIAVNVTAGIAPFTYTLISVPGTPPQASNSFGSLFSGSYNVTIVDSAGCTKTITSVVGNDPKIKIDNLVIVNPSCNGLLNGTVTVNASLGVAPYQYAIDAGSYSNSKIFNGVGAGPHILHIKDANSCLIDSAIVIAEPAVLTNSLVSTIPSTCSGTPDGQIVVAAAGGTTPYQYTLDINGLTSYQAAATFPVIAGTYKVTVQDANACKANVTVVVDSVFTMFLDLGRDTTICAEQSIILQPNTNAGTTVFSYTPQSSLDKPDIKNPTAKPADTTKYRLTASWGICTLSDSITINVLRKPVANAGPDVVICYDTTTVLQASASNLSGTVNYLWSPASLLDGRADTTVVTARPDNFKTYYSVTVTDNYGCNFAVKDSVLVDMLPPVYAFAGNDTNAVLNAPHQLTATGAGIGGSYVWSFPAGVTLSSSSIFNPTAIFTPVAQPGTFHPDTNYYRLSVIATNQAGCWATDTVKINIFLGPTYYIPNAFSPNGDGMNDVFRPILVGINSTDYFRVYNRYGQLVFETARFMEGWDGKFKGMDQPSGNYVWVLKGKGKGGRPVEMKGSVILVR